MGQDRPFRSRGAFRPSFASSLSPREIGGRREGRVAAAPGAPARKRCARARRPQAQAVTTDLPCAVVYGLYRALPGEPAYCHRRFASAFGALRKTWRLHGRARTTRLCRPRTCRSSHGTVASTAFRSTFVTTRTPLIGVERADHTTDLHFGK